jgi:hypothetical protein
MSEVPQQGQSRAQENYNSLPENNLDFNMRIINPAWSDAIPNLVAKSKDGKYRYIEADGDIYLNAKDIVTNLDFFTRDIRLSNYSEADIKLVRWYLEYAGMVVNQKYFEAFNFCLIQVANISETSQGRGGFLRKIFNTLRMENVQGAIPTANKNFMTGKKNPES